MLIYIYNFFILFFFLLSSLSSLHYGKIVIYLSRIKRISLATLLFFFLKVFKTNLNKATRTLYNNRPTGNICSHIILFPLTWLAVFSSVSRFAVTTITSFKIYTFGSIFAWTFRAFIYVCKIMFLSVIFFIPPHLIRAKS